MSTLLTRAIDALFKVWRHSAPARLARVNGKGIRDGHVRSLLLIKTHARGTKGAHIALLGHVVEPKGLKW